MISRVNHAVTPGAATNWREARSRPESLGPRPVPGRGRRAGGHVDVVVLRQHGDAAFACSGCRCSSLAAAPFVAAVARAWMQGPRARPGMCPVYVHIAPNVGGFVGGDHVTALLLRKISGLATRPAWSWTSGPTRDLADLQGADLERLFPSGPALEGGHISCGMRAAEGAIERVGLRQTARSRFKVIGKKTPVGLWRLRSPGRDGHDASRGRGRPPRAPH